MTIKKPVKVITPTVEQRCTMCGDTKTLSTNFYKSYSILFKNNLENRMCCCKDCLIKHAEGLNKTYGNEQKALYETCKLIDSYYAIELYNKLRSQSNGDVAVFNIYFQKINSLPQYRDKTYTDSDSNKNIMEAINNMNDIDEELTSRWGRSFSREEVQFLEKIYHQWLTHHDCDKLSIQKLVQMICIKELEIRVARESNKATDKLEKSLMELMNSSNLTPRTMSAVNETDSSKIYGVWLRDIEQSRPAEYFKDKKIYADKDGIMDYFNRFVLRPMKNLLTNTREFDKEFMIEDEDEEEDKGDDE